MFLYVKIAIIVEFINLFIGPESSMMKEMLRSFAEAHLSLPGSTRKLGVDKNTEQA